MSKPDRIPLQVVRKGSTLLPLNEATEEEIRSLPEAVPLKMIRPSQDRSTPQLRLYFTILSLVSKNMDRPIQKDALHDWIKLRTGIVEFIPLRSGKVEEVPGSVALDKMEQPEFDAFFNRAMDLICECLTTVGRDDLLAQALKLLEGPKEPPAKPPPAFDVIQWAADLNRHLDFYVDIRALRTDWTAHKAELKQASPNLFASLNKAVVEHANKIGQPALQTGKAA